LGRWRFSPRATLSFLSHSENTTFLACDPESEQDRLGVIDFDDCGFSWYFYDFAAAVSFIEHQPIVPELQAEWVSGYRNVAPVSNADEAMLPTFVMLRRMLLTAWIASHSETDTARTLGTNYTQETVAMGERFLRA
jgi:Ser/Thr protein kinase RdoA (MazF antagonist)